MRTKTKPKIYCAALVLVLTGLAACYRFEPLADRAAIRPAVAFPVAFVNQNIDNSLVLFGAPEINLEEEVAEWAQHREVYFIDTITFALSSIYQQTELIRYMVFKLLVWNDFPASANAQIVFLDQSDAPIDSLFTPNALRVLPALVSNQGTVIVRGATQTDIAITEMRIENLRRVQQIVIKCSASNVGVPVENFQYYLNYNLSVKLSVRMGLSIIID